MTQKAKKAVKTEPSVAQRILALEKICRKVIRVAFKDNTLDYTIQVAVTSLEPGIVKYGFMINGLKKEIQPIAMSYESYETCKAVLEGMLESINTVELEKNFHQGRINVYSHAITSHEERLKFLEEHPEGDPDDDIEMEAV